MFRGQHDVIIIGSSLPLMLAAIKFRQAGKSVLIIEASETVGGAWKVDQCLVGISELRHERACHLIEWYSGGYRLLEKLSSCPFVPLTPQPVKVWKNGRVARYTSKSSIVREYMLSWRSVAILFVKLMLACLGVGNYSIDKIWHSLLGAIKVVRFASRYRLPGVIQFDAIREPQGGFARFDAHLQGRLQNLGIEIFHDHALSMTRNESNYTVFCAGGARLNARRIVVGESSHMECNDGRVRVIGGLKDYHHVLISFPATRVVTRNAYVHFVDDDIFHRMTFVEDVEVSETETLSFFLVQLRRPYAQVGDFVEELERVFGLYEIAKSMDGIKIWKTIDDRHVSSSSGSSWHAYKGGRAVLVRTIGDLSRNVILMNTDRFN